MSPLDFVVSNHICILMFEIVTIIKEPPRVILETDDYWIAGAISG